MKTFPQPKHANRRLPFAVVFMVSLALVACDRAVDAAPGVGSPAPEFAGVDSNGTSHQLSDYRGKTIVLEWTNHDCPYVRKHYSTGNMQSLQKRATERGVVWLSVISSAPGKQGHVSPTQANDLTASRGAAPTAVILDRAGDIGRLYGAKTTPHMYIVDAQGTLVYMGGIDDTPTTNPADVKTAHNYVQAALDELDAGKEIGEPVTRPYGCSVKY
jgi:peroxiredoxin